MATMDSTFGFLLPKGALLVVSAPVIFFSCLITNLNTVHFDLEHLDICENICFASDNNVFL